MVDVAQIALCLLALAILVPVCVLLLQVLMSLPRQRVLAMPAGRRPSVAVLIPAHDEALLIATTLRTLSAQLGSGDRMIVIADNCSDDTAAIAAAAGAEVIERRDRERRGKGYALDFGVGNFGPNVRSIIKPFAASEIDALIDALVGRAA